MTQFLALATLVVADYDAAIDFYVGKLGFSLSRDDDMGGGKRWVVVTPPGSQGGLLLAKAASGEQTARIGDQTGGRVAFFLTTDDFARDAARLSAAGAMFEEAPRSESYGIVAVWRDPFGNRWDLIQPV